MFADIDFPYALSIVRLAPAPYFLARTFVGIEVYIPPLSLPQPQHRDGGDT